MPEDKAGFAVSPHSLPTQSNIWSSLIDGCQWSLSFILRHIFKDECRFSHMFGSQWNIDSWLHIYKAKQTMFNHDLLFVFLGCFCTHTHTHTRTCTGMCLFLFVSVCSWVWGASSLCAFVHDSLFVCECVWKKKIGREKRNVSSEYYLCEAYGR